MKRPRKLASARAQRFCSALATETRDRPNWWVAIQTVADRLGLEGDEAILIADECAASGYVMHDQSQHTSEAVKSSRLPHSVTLRPGGWEPLRRR